MSAISQSATLYVVTAYQFNHVERSIPIDSKFLEPPLNSVFYFVDKTGAPSCFPNDSINEIDLNPRINKAGQTHLAEWTFFLTEYEKCFAQYPFFVTSSRFFEKNERLSLGLAAIWDKCIQALQHYGWGYLPSYNRKAGFEDLRDYWNEGHLAMTEQGLDIIKKFYGIRYINDYRYASDFFCNYIGFASRKHFEKYVEFYLPFIWHFFDKEYNVLVNGNDFCRKLNVYRNEKPFTFLLELISHLFFYLNRIPFVGISYDGIYEVHEREEKMRRISLLDDNISDRSRLEHLLTHWIKPNKGSEFE